jgi:hypothetical protein
MAEVAGLVIGVVSLYSACRDCFIFFNNVKNAEKGAFLQIRDLGIQESILKSWGFYWEIQRHSLVLGDGKGEANQKLANYLGRNEYKTIGVLNALFAIADSLSDQEKLFKTYGISIATVSEACALEDSRVPLTLAPRALCKTLGMMINGKHQTSCQDQFGPR